MVEHVWEDILSAQDASVISKAGYDEDGASSWDSRGLGEKPALLVIDMQRKAAGPDDSILEAIEEYRTGMGEVAWRGVDEIVPVIETAREHDVTIYYTRSTPTSDDPNHPDLAILDELAPEPGDEVIQKSYASAFYGTDLLSRLIREGIDTLVLTGTSTSGCVRATAVDAQSNGFAVVVPQECVFDRIQASHKAALLDLWMKYAEVLTREEVESYLGTLETSHA